MTRDEWIADVTKRLDDLAKQVKEVGVDANSRVDGPKQSFSLASLQLGAAVEAFNSAINQAMFSLGVLANSIDSQVASLKDALQHIPDAVVPPQPTGDTALESVYDGKEPVVVSRAGAATYIKPGAIAVAAANEGRLQSWLDARQQSPTSPSSSSAPKRSFWDALESGVSTLVTKLWGADSKPTS